MVLKDKIKDFLFISGFFGFLILIILIFNIYSKPDKDYYKNKIEEFEKHLSHLPNNYKNDFKNKKISINFWHNLYSEEQETLKEIIKEFNQNYPKIEVIDSNKENWSQILKNISNALNVDKQPHLAFSYPDHIEFYSKSGKVIPLDIFEKLPNNADYISKNFLSNYVTKMNLNEQKEKYYYLPFLKTTEIMFYDSSLLEDVYKKSDSKNKEELNKFIENNGQIKNEQLTWEDMEQICKIIKKTYKKNCIPILIDSEDNLFIITVEQKKINYPKNKKDLESFFKKNEVHEIFKYFKRNFYDKDYLTFSKLSGENQIKNFILNKNICFYITSTRRLDTLCKIPNWVPSISLVPIIKDTIAKNILQGPNINLFYSENKDEMIASWLFLEHLTSQETYKKILQNNKIYNICRQDILLDMKNEKNYKNITSFNNEYTKEEKEKREEKNKMRENFFKKFVLKNAQKKDYFFTSPIFENSNYLRTILTDLFLEMLTIKNIKDEQIQKAFEEAYKRYETN